jgi:predicted transcriptional regulator
MATTIQISDEVKQKLERMKLFARESYNEILERMIEDELELNEQTKREIEEARKGKSISHEEVRKRLGL